MASLKGRDSLDDIAKLPFAGLVNADVKSASRLRQMVRGIFHVDVDIEERVGSWLTFEPSDRLLLGGRMPRSASVPISATASIRSTKRSAS